jgi:hypothetical protein
LSACGATLGKPAGGDNSRPSKWTFSISERIMAETRNLGTMNKLNAMKAFVSVVDHGSFTASARKLGVSVSSAT